MVGRGREDDSGGAGGRRGVEKGIESRETRRWWSGKKSPEHLVPNKTIVCT